MNNSTKFEDRASSSPSTHEGEPSESLCDRLSRTRDTSQRQLPTDQDYAVSTLEYQTDQSSLKHASTAACPVLEKQQKQPQRQKTTPQIRRDGQGHSISEILRQLRRSRGMGEPHLELDHSCLRAVVGSTPLARKAGTKPANPAATARTIAEPTNVKGSRGLNP